MKSNLKIVINLIVLAAIVLAIQFPAYFVAGLLAHFLCGAIVAKKVFPDLFQNKDDVLDTGITTAFCIFGFLTLLLLFALREDKDDTAKA